MKKRNQYTVQHTSTFTAVIEKEVLMRNICLFSDDGFISFKEYVAIMRDNYKDVDLERERMLAAFRYIDKNNDGYLTLKELKAVLLHKNKDITTEEIEEFFREVDKDGDGKIDYEGT
jgi:Ca2+-binding EF-hand superfamily protein